MYKLLRDHIKSDGLTSKLQKTMILAKKDKAQVNHYSHLNSIRPIEQQY